ncbi:unnamed protein product, partial [Coregonus sp. 'balchen']
MLQRQEEEVQRIQAYLDNRLSQASLYPGDDRRTSGLYPGDEPLALAHNSMLDLRDPLNATLPHHCNPRRKVGVVLLNGQKLELSCDIKAVCKDVLDMVVAHVGLVEHHLFGLACLKDIEFFFIDPDAKLSKVAPEGWKDKPKKKKPHIQFNLFLRIKHTMTKHQYYLQLSKDILEERMRCDMENAMLLASLALQAEFGDYKAELHGNMYFRLEHDLSASVLDKIDQSSIKEELPKLHSTYYGATEAETEFEFLKWSQTGIMLGVYSKGVLIFEVLNGNRTPVLRFPWRETKKISFT